MDRQTDTTENSKFPYYVAGGKITRNENIFVMVSVVTTTEMRITQGTSGALRTDTTLVITTSRLTVTVIKTIRDIKGLVTEVTMGRSMEVIIPDTGEDIIPDTGEDIIPDTGEDIIPDTGKDIIPNTEDIIPDTKKDMATVGLGILIKTGLMIFRRDSSVTSTTTVRILLQVQEVLILLLMIPIGIRQTTNGMEPLTMNPDIAHHRIQGIQ